MLGIIVVIVVLSLYMVYLIIGFCKVMVVLFIVSCFLNIGV